MGGGQAARVVEGEDAGGVRGGEVADAVTGDRVGTDPGLEEQPGERGLQGEEAERGVTGLRRREMRAEEGADLVEGGGEGRDVRVGGGVRRGGCLGAEAPGDLLRGAVGDAHDQAGMLVPGGQRPCLGKQLGVLAADDDGAVFEGGARGGQGVADLGGGGRRVRGGQSGDEGPRLGPEGLRCTGGQGPGHGMFGRGGSGGCGDLLGASSMMRWALVPEVANAEMPARRGRSRRGQPTGSVSSRTAPFFHAAGGVGRSTWSVRGRVPCCRALTILMSAAVPAAPCVCPVLDLTEPSHRGRSCGRWAP